MKRKLPVNVPPPFRSVFFYALPSACISADPSQTDWFHMNYLDFYGYKNTVNADRYEFRFADSVSYVDRGLHSNTAVAIDRYDLSRFSCKDIIEFITDSIDTYNYVILYLDESRLFNSPFSEGFHEYLVYGYDSEQRILYLLGMNSNEDYSEIIYSYDIITDAYESMCSSGEHGRILYRLCVTNRYSSLAGGESRYFSHLITRKFDEEVFVNKIRTYLSGKISHGEVTILNSTINPTIACGIQTYDLFEQYLNEIKNGSGNYEYNVPFFFEDHKQALYARLLFAYKKTSRSVYLKTAENFHETVMASQAIKNLHLIGINSNSRNTERIISLVQKTRAAEALILKDI
ncbi:MAG: hypothetical protein IJY86_09555 [Clostridia bacterium]|nr:hypothetical protein [Clostridia bacterium]